jgi:nitroreductase
MEVFEAIQKRRSARAYLPDPVPEDKLERILEAGRIAPSASNIQPWHFIVVRDEHKREKLAKSGVFARFLSQSPVVIVGCGNRKASPKWSIVDTAIAMQNVVLAATGEGLGTYWVGSFKEEEVKELLNIPDEMNVIALLAVGYPHKRLDLLAKIAHLIHRRKKPVEIVSLDEFGKPFSKNP